ncbi:hypothetical protein DCO58_11105 [Helicobacter saguini]|uniref:Uncharacterized protein n=1 Tax=Helicobacter saguini TaxID=1548018 RepID=A0A4U8T725_9HELI|nr:hypothetical protein [Helicobacter saguini]MWV68174.1 hypothetical protein [Helicobacter saguini]TLD95308.1 hypothetical protein LS64_002870 [Helicobacter saguini]
MNFRYFFRDSLRKFRKGFYTQTAKFFGNYETNKLLKEILESNRALNASINASSALSSSKIPQSIKDSYFLQSYPTPGGGIRFSNARDNIRAFLNLVRPVTSSAIKLRRFGGGYDGGYVMSVPPLLESRLNFTTLHTNEKGEILDIKSHNVANNEITPPPR